MRSMRILILERSERTLVLLLIFPAGGILKAGRTVGLMLLIFEFFFLCMRILILDFFYSLREAYYKGERILILLRSSRTLVLPLGRSVALMFVFFL